MKVSQNTKNITKIYLVINLLLVLITGCQAQPQVANFDECVAAGNPVMESNPPQCRHKNTTYAGQALVYDEELNKSLPLQQSETKELVTEPEESPTTIPTKLYRGNYFDVDYPKTFTPDPAGPINAFNDFRFPDAPTKYSITTDEATFTSPDGSLELFVFSPLWAGDPINYLELADNEELVSEKTEEVTTESGLKTIIWKTIKAKDNSYYRSYISEKDENYGSLIHHVFGIKYTSQEAYDKYKPDYLKFKESLKQYAD